MALAFQYGSNCLDKQINGDRRLRRDARFIGIAETVEEFQLAFDVWSNGRNCAAADMVPSLGNRVWEALYEIPDFLIHRESAKAQGRTSLDAIEGDGVNYRREPVLIRQENGQIVTAITYRGLNPKQELMTSLEYVGCIVRERGVCEDYIDVVKKLALANNPTTAGQVQEL